MERQPHDYSRWSCPHSAQRGRSATCARHQLPQRATLQSLPLCAAHTPLSAVARRRALDGHKHSSGGGKRCPNMRQRRDLEHLPKLSQSCSSTRLRYPAGTTEARDERQQIHHGAARKDKPSRCIHARARRTHQMGAAGRRSALSPQRRASFAAPRSRPARRAVVRSYPRRGPVGRARRRWARRTLKGTTGRCPARRSALARERRGLKVGPRVGVTLFGLHTKGRLA